MVISVIAAIAAETIPAWYKEWINVIWGVGAAGLGAGLFAWAGWLIGLALIF